jgi:hypothetical protein
MPPLLPCRACPRLPRLLKIVELMAPPVYVVPPLVETDAEIMPPGIEPQHGPIAQLAARLMGPLAPPPPVEDVNALWAAAAAAANGGGPGAVHAALAAVGPMAAGAGVGGGNANPVDPAAVSAASRGLASRSSGCKLPFPS